MQQPDPSRAAERYGADAAVLKMLPYRRLSKAKSMDLGRCVGRVLVRPLLRCSTVQWQAELCLGRSHCCWSALTP